MRATGLLSGAGPFACTYSVVGSDTFTVPNGISQATVTVVGAQGGHYFIDGPPITGRPGGAGGRASGTLSVVAGQVLQVDVAGKGANGTAASRTGGMGNGPSGGTGATGGFGGSNGGIAGGAGDASGANGGTAASNGGNGSGGGGASDVRFAMGGCAALTCGLSTRLLVGAGGGGGGGIGGSGNALGGAGGDGGGASGGDGGATVDGGNHGTSGLGASQSAGGAAGQNPPRHAAGQDPADPRLGFDGTDGTSGKGGVGGAGNAPLPPATTSGGGAAGGGGGGLFGGGGGGGGGGPFGGGGGAGGGGGGGSSFVTASATDAALTPGVNAGTINGGDGQVTISWTTAPLASPTLTTAASAPVAVGGRISASATLSGGMNPGGTISFAVYGPGDTSCQTALTTKTATVTGNGTFGSGNYFPPSPGVYRWVSTYSGDAGNHAAGPTACGDPAAAVVVSAPPTATTGAATGTTDTGVELAGVTNPEGSQTNYTFEYGTSTTFGSISPVSSAGAGFDDVPVTASLSGLTAATTYYYRLVATNAVGTRFGAVGTFTTTGTATAPTAVTLAPTSAGTTSAVLSGQVNPNRQATAYTFEYGTSTSFGSITPVVALDAANSPEAVSASATGLTPNTIYYYRLVATNATGTTEGAIRAFRTTPLSSAPASSLYTLVYGEATASQFTVTSDGTLTPKSPAALSTIEPPRAIAVSPDGHNAYIGLNTMIGQYTIASDGTLSPNSPATVPSRTPYVIAVSPDSKSVYVTAFCPTDGSCGATDWVLEQFTAAPDGTLSPKTAPLSLPNAIAAGIVVTPDGKNVYVTTYDNDSGVGRLYQFTAAADGTLSPNAPASFATGSFSGPIVTSPDGKNVYVANQGDNTVSQFAIAADGTLSLASTTSGVSGSFLESMAISHNGKNLYVGTFDSTVAQFTIARDGTLTPKTTPTVATGNCPDNIVISADDRNVYVDNGCDANLSLFIVGADGGLSPNSTTPIAAISAQFMAASPPVNVSTPPAATTGLAGSITTTSAQLAGVVNPDGQKTSYTFEYGTSTSFGSITPVVALDDATDDEPVTATLGGLAPGTTYLYRLIATNASGTTIGTVHSFTTPPAA